MNYFNLVFCFRLGVDAFDQFERVVKICFAECSWFGKKYQTWRCYVFTKVVENDFEFYEVISEIYLNKK